MGVRTDSNDEEAVPVRRSIPMRFFCDLIDGTNFDGVRASDGVILDCVGGVLRSFVCWADSVAFVSENNLIHY